MIYNKYGEKFADNGKTFVIGNRVIANSESEYEGLYGVVTEIRTGDDRETENDTPDIYCDFEIPAQSKDIKELEKRFSELYETEKTIDDIALDCIIMAPSMIEPEKILSVEGVFVLKEEWTCNDDYGDSISIYADLDDAKKAFEMQIKEEQAEGGIIAMWAEYSEGFREDASSDMYYECWINGNYTSNNYKLTISKYPMYYSKNSDFVKRVADKTRNDN